jgi:mannose-6-phosphate isomerase-like protein (cupin superfamily)
MEHSRRELGSMLPLLFAAGGRADTTDLQSRMYPFDQLEVKTNGQNQMRAIFSGQTNSGCPLEIHITNLPPGGAPHPPHHHVHDEMILIQEGTMEVTIAGKTSRLGPGSVAYVASNQQHGWRNVGDGRAQYFVLAIGQDKS